MPAPTMAMLGPVAGKNVFGRADAGQIGAVNGCGKAWMHGFARKVERFADGLAKDVPITGQNSLRHVGV